MVNDGIDDFEVWLLTRFALVLCVTPANLKGYYSCNSMERKSIKWLDNNRNLEDDVCTFLIKHQQRCLLFQVYMILYNHIQVI